MKGHNIRFKVVMWKIIPFTPSNLKHWLPVLLWLPLLLWLPVLLWLPMLLPVLQIKLSFNDTSVALLFYVHGKHLRSCRDGQLT